MKRIFVVPYGGLGNQLFQVAAALAESQGGTVYVLAKWGFARTKTSGEPEICSFIKDDRVQILSEEIGQLKKRLLNFILRVGVKAGSNLAINLFINILEILLSPFFSLCLGNSVKLRVNRGVGHSNLRCNSDSIIVGYFQSYVWAEAIQADIFRMFIPRMSQLAVKLSNDILTDRATVVHVRAGDYKNTDFGLLNNDYYRKALAKLRLPSSSHIYVFSDEISEAKKIEAFEAYTNVHFVDDSNLNPGEIIMAMAAGANFIIANSSFSWWAAYLRKNKTAQVIAPKPWFDSKITPHNILDPQWDVITR